MRSLLEAIHAQHPFTPQEARVLALLAEGLRNKEIAERLSIGPGTVGMHVQHVFWKLDVGNRKQAVNEARRRGLLA